MNSNFSLARGFHAVVIGGAGILTRDREFEIETS